MSVVRRKADDKLGSFMFQHFPRYYFAFHEDNEISAHESYDDRTVIDLAEIGVPDAYA